MINFSALFSQLFSAFWWLSLISIALFKPAWFKSLIRGAMVNIASRLFLDNHVSSNNSRLAPETHRFDHLPESAPVIRQFYQHTVLKR